MTEVQEARDGRSLGSRLASTVLVIMTPILLLGIVAAVGGSTLGIGTPELTLLAVLWVGGLIWVWRPRRGRQHASRAG